MGNTSRSLARTRTPQERSPLAVRMPVTVSHVRSFGRSSRSSCTLTLVSIVARKAVPSCSRAKYRRNHVPRHCRWPLADDDCCRTADRRRPSRKGIDRERYVYCHMTCRIDVDFLNFILSTIKQINITRGSKLYFIFCRRSISVNSFGLQRNL